MRKSKVQALSLVSALLFSANLLPKDPPDHVPFKLYRGYTIVARGSIGKLHKLNFLIDTGAVPSVVDAAIARKLHLVGTADRLSVFNQSVEAQRVVLPDVEFGPERVAGLPVLVRDLSFIEDGLGVHVDAMIGLDVLGRESFTIDFESQTLRFGPLDKLESSAALEEGPGYVTVQMLVAGRPVHLAVDTGAKDVILFAPRVHGRLPQARVEGSQSATNLSGAVPLERVSLPATRLGNEDLGSVNGFLMQAPPESLPNFDGLLGVTSLDLRRIGFDFTTRTIRWEKHRR